VPSKTPSPSARHLPDTFASLGVPSARIATLAGLPHTRTMADRSSEASAVDPFVPEKVLAHIAVFLRNIEEVARQRGEALGIHSDFYVNAFPRRATLSQWIGEDFLAVVPGQGARDPSCIPSDLSSMPDVLPPMIEAAYALTTRSPGFLALIESLITVGKCDLTTDGIHACMSSKARGDVRPAPLPDLPEPPEPTEQLRKHAVAVIDMLLEMGRAARSGSPPTSVFESIVAAHFPLSSSSSSSSSSPSPSSHPEILVRRTAHIINVLQEILTRNLAAGRCGGWKTWLFSYMLSGGMSGNLPWTKTPLQTPSETPSQTPSETPSETPLQTPSARHQALQHDMIPTDRAPWDEI
jgi:hypothetical protein